MSIGSGFLSAGWSKFAGISNWWMYGIFAFCSTLCVYNLQRLIKSPRYKRTPWLEWVLQYRMYLYVLVAVSACTAAITFFLLLNYTWLTLAIMAFSISISLFYVIRVYQDRNLRDIPYLKIHLIALTWVIVLVLFPLLNEGHFSRLLPYAGAHYAYVLAITIPFDIRDLKYDEVRQRTIPQVLGVWGAKAVGVLLLLLFAGMMCFIEPALQVNLWFYLAFLTQIGLVLGMTEKRSDLYCAGAIDGAIVLLGLAYFTA